MTETQAAELIGVIRHIDLSLRLVAGMLMLFFVARVVYALLK